MTAIKAGARAAIDRFLKTYFDRLTDDVTEMRAEVSSLLRSFATTSAQVRGELESLRSASGAALDELRDQLVTQEGPRLDAVEAKAGQLLVRFGEVESNVVHQLEGQAKRQAELRQAMDDHARAMREAMEKLELLFLKQLEGLFGAVHGETANLRSDIAELTRMIRMQGDAADEVAEVMGRTLARLSAEVDALSLAIEGSQARREEAPSPA